MRQEFFWHGIQPADVKGRYAASLYFTRGKKMIFNSIEKVHGDIGVPTPNVYIGACSCGSTVNRAH